MQNKTISRTLRLNNRDIHYKIVNPDAKQIILMIHGFRGSHDGLMYMAAELKDVQSIILDLPGYGNSAPMSDKKHDPAGYAKEIVAIAAALELKDFILLGHSYGAIIAAKTIIDGLPGACKLILMNPVSQSSKYVAALGKGYYRLGLALPKSLGKRLFYSKTINRMQSLLLLRSKDKAIRKRVYAHHLHDLTYPYHAEVIADSFKSVMGMPMVEYGPLIQLPTLLIAGELDDLAPLAAQKKLAQTIPDCKLEIITGVAHIVPLEKPAEAAALISNYIK